MADLRARVQAREALKLHSEGQHAEALTRAMKLARANPGSAPALNLVGALHVHASGDDQASPALVTHYRRAAIDSFSAASRIAPNCLITAVLHAEALVAAYRVTDAQLELLRVLSTAACNHADPAVNHVAYDMVGGSTAEVRKSDAVFKASVVVEDLAAMISDEIVPVKLVGAVEQVGEGARLLSRTYPYSAVRPLSAATAPSSTRLRLMEKGTGKLDLDLDRMYHIMYRPLAIWGHRPHRLPHRGGRKAVNPTAAPIKRPVPKFEEQVDFTVPIMTGDPYWDECNSQSVKIFGIAAKVRKNIYELENRKPKNSDASLSLWRYLRELLLTAEAIEKTLALKGLVPYPEPQWFRNRRTGMAVSLDLADWQSQVAGVVSPEVPFMTS